jgi:hypothetical protein
VSDFEAMAAIDTYVAQHGRPAVVSLTEDTHIFHFEQDGEWRNAPLLLVNRNGHHFRLIKQDDGKFLFCKTWNGLLTRVDDWMIEANLRRADPEELIALCGIGPQGRQTHELLSLLPKGSTHRRAAVWRHQIYGVWFDVDNNKFRLTDPDKRDATSSPGFTGKLWESQEAAKWCLAHMSAPTLARPKGPSVEDEEIMAELEGSEMWGMF